VSDPEILRGKPRIKGTRIPVGLVLGHLAAGKSAQEIVAEFPDLSAEQIMACKDYARELAEFEAVVRGVCDSSLTIESLILSSLSQQLKDNAEAQKARRFAENGSTTEETKRWNVLPVRRDPSCGEKVQGRKKWRVASDEWRVKGLLLG
jgi:uncharacterized protein (DUF433 family)